MFAGSDQVGKSGSGLSLSQNHEVLCALADSVLVTTMNEIVDGTVIFQTVKILEQRKHQFLRLCDANKDSYSVAKIKEFMDHRISECMAFKRHVHNLENFCFQVYSRLKVEGI